MDVDVAIVGAGLAGISAAVEAKRAGAEVVVLEAGPTAGGKAQTIDGIEKGPHSFAGRHEVFWQLLEALGLTAEANELPKITHTRFIARGGRLQALKPSPLTMIGTGAFTVGEKLAVLRDLVGSRPVAPAASVHDFFGARFGQSFADGPLAAMISGIFSGDPRDLSLDACFPDLQARAVEHRSILRGLMKGPKPARRGFFTLSGGLGRMGAAAAAQLPIQLNTPVRELARDGGGFRVNGSVRARALVVATEAPAAAKLLWPLSPTLGAALGKLQYAAISKVHWRGDEAGFAPGFGYLACPGEGLFALGTMFHERGFSTFVRGVEQSEDALVAGVQRDVAKLTGGKVGEVLRVDRWSHAVFQPTLEVLPTRASLGALADEAGVVLAGSYLGAAAMKDAITTGFAAGKKAHELSQRTPAWSRSLS